MNKITLKVLICLSSLQIFSQPFTSEIQISNNNLNGPQTIFSADLDGDGDNDILSGDSDGQQLFWYENNGNGTFSNRIIISNDVDNVREVYVDDIDLDGDLDLVCVSALDAGVFSGSENNFWFEKVGNTYIEHVLPQNSFTTGSASVRTGDINGDGYIDIVFTTHSFNERLVWYQNDGNQNFSIEVGTRPINGLDIQLDDNYSLILADIDNDNDLDVITASFGDNSIDIYSNDGGASSFTKITLSTNANSARRVNLGDIDNDGDLDIVSASIGDDKIAWYENQGSLTFSQENIISTNVNGATDVSLSDIDGDGDLDVLACGALGHEICWFENNGNSVFGIKNTIGVVTNVFSTIATNLNSDNAIDIVSVSPTTDQILWYKNLRLCVPTYDSITEEICQGDSYDFSGTIYSSSGVYTDTILNNEGCDSIRTLTLTVKPTSNTAIINITDISNEGVCEGSLATYSSQISNTIGNITYQWKKGNTAIAGATNINYSFTKNINDNGSIISCLITSDDICLTTPSTTSNSILVNVFQQADNTINFNGSELSVNAGYSYQWFKNGQLLQNETNDTYTPINNGLYTVIISNNGCITEGEYDLQSIGVNENQESVQFIIYPNPSNGIITISNQKQLEAQLFIYNSIGILVIEQQLLINNKIDFTELGAGIYNVVVKYKTASFNQKLILR